MIGDISEPDDDNGSGSKHASRLKFRRKSLVTETTATSSSCQDSDRDDESSGPIDGILRARFWIILFHCAILQFCCTFLIHSYSF